MRQFVFILFMLCFPAVVVAQSDFDFRNTTWGMSRVEVLASEDMKPIKITDEYLSYKFNLFGKETYLLYEFVENSLLCSRYVFENVDESIVSQIYETLYLKYGKAKVENLNSYIWDTNDVDIHMEKDAKYFKVVYKSKKIGELERRYKSGLDEDQKKYLMSIF